MKIKLVKFEDIDMDGSTEVDYGLSIGKVYDVVGRDAALGSFIVLNSVGKPTNVFYDEAEVQ